MHRGRAWPTPQPPRPGHDVVSHQPPRRHVHMVRRRRERAGPPWQSRPGSLGQPARLHRRRAARRLNRRARAKAQLSTRLAVHVRYNSTWSPTALSSAVTAFRCLDGYDRHKEPPTPFGGRAASSSQIEIHLNSSHARGARARTVPTVSGDAILKALVRLAAHAASAAAQAGARGPWSGGTGVDRHRARRARGILSLWCIGPARANVMRFR